MSRQTDMFRGWTIQERKRLEDIKTLFELLAPCYPDRKSSDYARKVFDRKIQELHNSHDRATEFKDLYSFVVDSQTSVILDSRRRDQEARDAKNKQECCTVSACMCSSMQMFSVNRYLVN
jgi:hypothetical protein